MLPLINAHTGPYYCYWTDILILHVALTLICIILRDSTINLLAIIVTVLFLFVYQTLFGSMYQTLTL